MTAPIYLGDEVSAAGYRLAGAQVRVPEPGASSAALARALADAPLVLLSAAVAARIGDSALRSALAATAPLVLVVPDTLGTTRMPDVAARMRAQLGLEA
jgi:vacuolar-type H+-ATPase subunit F/Vma7